MTRRTLFYIFSISAFWIFSFFIKTYAYSPSEKDTIWIQSFQQRIDLVSQKYPAKLSVLENLVVSLRTRYASSERIMYIMNQLYTYIQEKKNILTTTDGYLVTSVIDGDTIKVYYSGESRSVRMIGIDAPERSTTRFWYVECFGEEAGIHLQDLVAGQYVDIVFDPSQDREDKYGRLLAYVFLKNQNINRTMIYDGYAWEYTYNLPYQYQSEFKQSQIDASTASRWLWASTACSGARTTWMNNSITEYTCGTKTYCTQMVSCEEARYFFTTCNLQRLDGDNDGIPCESLCGN